MNYNKKLGEWGEKKSASFLKNKGYVIKECNFHGKNGEIDIIAADDEELVFIEVKTRTTDGYGTPSDSVNYQKQMHIINTARYYILKNNLENTIARFDVIEVLVNTKGLLKRYKINHIKDAFQ